MRKNKSSELRIETKIKFSSKKAYYLAGFIWIAFITILLVTQRIGESNTPLSPYNLLFNSDSLIFPIFIDVWKSSGSLEGLFVFNATYLFPDFILQWLVSLLPIGIPFQYLMIMAIQLGTMLYLLEKISSTFKSTTGPRSAFTVFAFLTILASTGQQPFGLLLISGFHGGQVLAGLLIIWLVLEERAGTPLNFLQKVLIFFVSFFTSFSDQLFLVIFVIPIVIVLLIEIFRKSSKGKFAPTITFFGGLIAFTAIRLIGVPGVNAPLPFSFENLPANISKLFAVLSQVWAQNPLLLPLCAYLAVSGAGRLLLDRRHHLNAPQNNYLLLIGVFTAATSAVAVVLQPTDPQIRYLIGAFVVGLMGLIFWADQAALSMQKTNSFLLLLFLLVMSSNLLHATENQVKNDFAYPKEIKCIDNALKLNPRPTLHGIATYWDARQVQALSHLNLQIAQYDYELNRFNWITPPSYFDKPVDFALFSRRTPIPYQLSPVAVRKALGPPNTIKLCDQFEIWSYNLKPRNMPPSRDSLPN